MPGNSIWLIPPPSHPLTSVLTKLIHDTLPPLFADETPLFIPHVTLTSNVPIETEPSEITEWVSDFADTEELVVRFKKLDVGSKFFTRLTLHVKKTPALQSLAVELRQRFSNADGAGDEEAMEKWGAEDYIPHLSLVYSNMTQEAVIEDVLKEALEAVEKSGIVVGSEEKEGDKIEEEGMWGWKGGRVVVVDTWREVEKWKVLAEVEL